MSIHVALNHSMHYRYDRPVMLGPQIVRLRPAPHCRSRILSYSLKIEPAEHFINWQQDPQSNHLARLMFPKAARELRIEVDLVAEMAVLNPFDFFLEPYAQQFPFRYEAAEERDLAPFLATAPATPRLTQYLAGISRAPRATVDFLVELNRRLAADVQYLIRLEPGVQPPEVTLEKRSGSCRDSAELLVQLLRHLGLGARFVSGYLIQLAADSKPLDGPAGPSRDFTDLHAWCEVYLPGAGWIGLDPTSGLLTGEGHIPLACTSDPQTAAPLSGAVERCETRFEYAMSVARVWEAPRVTKPYSDAQWAAIDALGKRVDERLEAADVRLTLGGEPTFVSSEDALAPEWNTEALGENKRRVATELYWKLKARYAPLGLAHFGQGKWYPGEQLPRWSLNCFWRKDGEPIWSDAALIADGKRRHAEAGANAPRLLAAIAARLGVSAEHVFPAYEDVLYYAWRERRLPANVDALRSRVADPLERARLTRLFEGDLGEPVGYVLPIARPVEGAAWRSGSWFLRSERCYLIPGDSPVGYRLPLDSLPWVRESDFPHVHPTDPMQEFAPLAPYREYRDPAPSGAGADAAGADAAGADAARAGSGPRRAATAPSSAAPRQSALGDGEAAAVVRTSLCAEARDGVLYVFMPPTRSLEDYLEIIAAVQAGAASLEQPVIVEGYEPPADPRLCNFKVTPDPGVIEVNVQPSASWEELVERTSHLYEMAGECRLRSEKFMIDGRHVGTGGGNHIVLGGATPEDSPFLRRPDLLRSLLCYWHNHPSLSYLFSGLFIGPTSQAPRVDEARNDSLYELELAFKQFPEPGATVPPWLTDRLLRNLLIDVTGNTHRAEFCIDKLYAPGAASGRLGLLELRAFEMPPHARMSLVQQVLLRSLIARFWREPYAPQRLARWGTQLHDRFMLPHFILQDFSGVMEEQNRAGHAMRLEWFAPHFEFRFPKLGEVQLRVGQIELRQALEPWHVMGEEGTPGGTVRYVDSSLERLEVKVSGLAPDRYAVTCNGRALPLRSTGREGEYVAGVRYRAWQPWSALHPKIGVHSPLTFDIVDTWMHRSEGGCRYHVVHPGGRSHETLPVNAFEAESRRLARFFRIGHTPGPMNVEPAVPNEEFPFTLDLRDPR
ncbi:MAG TPA: transglutaminase family protein [Steroidobacteraceae bacterium]|nr:transglutaminase family protein [Steroidobacteraceae bacterium]